MSCSICDVVTVDEVALKGLANDAHIDGSAVQLLAKTCLYLLDKVANQQAEINELNGIKPNYWPSW